MRSHSWLRSTAITCIVSALHHGSNAGEVLRIDLDLAERAKDIQVAVPELSLRWRSLFSINPEWIPRQVAFISRYPKSDYGTLFAARLLYPMGKDPGPWLRDGGSFNAVKWESVDRDVRLAVLRDIRMQPDPAWTTVLGMVCWRFEDPTFVSQALATLATVNPDSAVAWSMRLALPDPAIPGSRNGELRALALHQACDLRNWDHPVVLPALRWALTSPDADPAECLAAIRLLPQRGANEVVNATIMHLDQELKQPRFTSEEIADEVRTAVVMACQHVQALDPAAAAVVVGWTLSARREIVCAAAAALGHAATESTNQAQAVVVREALPVEAVLGRLRTPGLEPAVRASLATLLLQVRPDSLVNSNDPQLAPWRAMAEHRRDVLHWETDGFVR